MLRLEGMAAASSRLACRQFRLNTEGLYSIIAANYYIAAPSNSVDCLHDVFPGAGGFDKLDEFGVIREIEKADERIKAICDLHVGTVREKRSSSVRCAYACKEQEDRGHSAQQLRFQGLVEEAEQSLCV
jgi:hypothetical protein